MKHYSSLGGVVNIIRKPGFWFILALLIFLTLLHYREVQTFPGFLVQAMSNLGLSRHALERILYMAPMVWAGFLFGWKGALITSITALACMLPRAIFISPSPLDAIIETSLAFIIGIVVSISFVSLRKEREYRGKLEIARQNLQEDAEQLREMQKNLRFYLHQVNKAQEEERKRISHELHDETIQALVALSRRLDIMASKNKELSADSSHELEEIWQQINDVIKEVRRLSQDLRPAALDRLGLLPALEWLASQVTEHSGIATNVSVVGKQRRLPEEIELVLFRITQEALRNMWRHSQASKAEIMVKFDKGKIKVNVTDDGQGFHIPDKIEDLARHGKLGLAGMYERAQLIGGMLTVQSNPGSGTSVSIEMPI